jgi:hypothetical protein
MSEEKSIVIREFENEIARYSDYLTETLDQIMYREYITPKKGKEVIPGMQYEEYVDINKKDLNGVTFEQIHDLLKNTKEEDRIKSLKEFLKSKNIPNSSGLWT